MPQVLGIDYGSIQAEESWEKIKKDFYVLRKKHTLVYIVLTDNTQQNEDNVLYQTPGLPWIGMLYKGAYCHRRTPVEVESRVADPVAGGSTTRRLFHVICEFDSMVDFSDQQQPPDQQAPKWRWYGDQEDEVLLNDVETGEPIQTACGEPLFITDPVLFPMLEIVRYEQTFDPDTMLTYANRTNSQPFWGAPAGCALMFPMQDEEVVISFNGENQKYRQVTYLIKFQIKDDPNNPGQFLEDTLKKIELLHHGTKYREVDLTTVSGFTDPIVNTDEFGHPTTINLEADGRKLTQGMPQVFLPFNRKTSIDFNLLNLGPFQ